MGNLFRICVLCLFLGVLANAQENNGVFLGFEAGAGEQKLTTDGNGIAYTIKGSAIVFGGKLGYKHLFIDIIGIRAYVGADYGETRVRFADGQSGVFSGITYTVNLDVLLNFYNSENVALGVFAGLGIGGQTAEDDNFLYNDKVRTITNFYSDVKLGLRVNATKNHEIEFIAKIPLNNATKTFNETIGTQKIDIKAKYRQNYKVLLGYNFAF